MKVEVTEVIRLVPAHLVVEEHRRLATHLSTVLGLSPSSLQQAAVVLTLTA